MNWDQIKGKWTEMSGDAKKTWGKLTDDDLAQAAGDRDKLVRRVQHKYGIAKEEVEKQVDDWTSQF